ncbi:hypothetical protein LguiA_008430 [Lonicera macranthoides]
MVQNIKTTLLYHILIVGIKCNNNFIPSLHLIPKPPFAQPFHIFNRWNVKKLWDIYPCVILRLILDFDSYRNFAYIDFSNSCTRSHYSNIIIFRMSIHTVHIQALDPLRRM